MRHLEKLVMAAWAAAAAPAMAENMVVVELFTSQGCSSCPPADALMGELAQRDDVLGLALHVDYWDYIGWKDEFASPAYTERQKAYARVHAKRSVYTPQMIIAGQDIVVGYKPMAVADSIQQHSAAAPSVELDVKQTGSGIRIEVAGADRTGAYVIDVVTFAEKRTVRIDRGENAGRTLDYHNIVSSWTRIGEWNGAGVFRRTVEVGPDTSLAVIVQEAGPGAVLAAERVR